MLKWLLFIVSVACYLLPLSDALLLSPGKEKVTLANHQFIQQSYVRDWKEIMYQVTLSDSSQFRIFKNDYFYLEGKDSCILYRTPIFNKITRVSVQRDDGKYVIGTGFYDTGGMFVLVVSSIVILLGLLFTVTQLFGKLKAAKTVILLVATVEIMMFIFYYTTL